MVTEKNIRFTNRNWDLKDLSQRVVEMLNTEKWLTQKIETGKGIVVQARKENILRDIFTADRALTILVSGVPNDFNIRVGIGRWVQNLTVAAVEAILTSGLFLIIDVPEMVWNARIENEVIKEITVIVESKQPAVQATVATPAM